MTDWEILERWVDEKIIDIIPSEGTVEEAVRLLVDDYRMNRRIGSWESVPPFDGTEKNIPVAIARVELRNGKIDHIQLWYDAPGSTQFH